MPPKPRPDVPGHALAIRELREKTGLSQPQLARELNIERGAIARWEAGVREPRPKKYMALAEIAKKRKLPELAAKFLSRKEEKSKDLERKKELRRTARDTELRKEYFLRTKAEARAGNEAAKRLIDLSLMNDIELSKLQGERISEARKSLANGAYKAKFDEIMDEYLRAFQIASGRTSLVHERYQRLIAALRRLPEIRFPDATASESGVRSAERRLARRRALLDDWKDVLAAARKHGPENEEYAIAMMEKFEAMLKAEQGAEGEPEEQDAHSEAEPEG
jgi:transcriptional regulator with XRE-family HTH domain